MRQAMPQPSAFPAARRALSAAAAVSLLLLGGCSSRPKLLPENEINEPVFHTTHFMGLGASLGPVWFRGQGDDGHERATAFDPRIYLVTNVNRWASFTLWPAFWNLLLTGEQYADGGGLKVRKIHLSFHGGVSGLTYSPKDGWQFTGLAQLTGKFLLDENWFVGVETGRSLYDLGDMAHGVNQFAADLGTQLSPRNSLRFTYGMAHYDLPDDSHSNTSGIKYSDGDVRTKLALQHSFYAGRKHVFGPEASLSYRNAGFEDGHAFGFGLHYRYLFD